MRDQLIGMIGARRRSLGWTVKELAHALGSSSSRVCKLEAGDASVSTDLLSRALEVMGLHVDVVIDDSKDPLADPELDAVQKMALARSLYRRAFAARIAERHSVDAGDVLHVLNNLERGPLERLARMRRRARLKRSIH